MKPLTKSALRGLAFLICVVAVMSLLAYDMVTGWDQPSTMASFADSTDRLSAVANVLGKQVHAQSDAIKAYSEMLDDIMRHPHTRDTNEAVLRHLDDIQTALDQVIAADDRPKAKKP